MQFLVEHIDLHLHGEGHVHDGNDLCVVPQFCSRNKN